MFMRLKVTFASNLSRGNEVWYRAVPDITRPNQDTETTRRHVERLARRIELVGKNLLGQDLVHVCTQVNPGAICFQVTKGLSTSSKKFDFRSFIGWVEIFDTETGLATRAAMPPIR
jgi:hypothetical protein